MMISVVLCTYNRCELLVKALESVAASHVHVSVEWEVVVVDNNSNDRTREVVDEFATRYPSRFRYLFESQPGKSHALNAGVSAAQGEILAFMDDDVSVDPVWLETLTAPLRGATDWSGTGGPVVLHWSCPPPSWFDMKRTQYMGPLAGFDLGDQALTMHEPPFGTNMAFRKTMFTMYGLFRTDLGPSPRTDIPRPNEDTEFGRRLLAGGERLRYVPAAVVHHPVPEDRLRKEYFLQWWYDKARADVREQGSPAGALAIRGVPLYLFRRLAVWSLRWMISPVPSARFECKLKVWGKLGAITESRYQLARSRNAKKQKQADEKTQCATVI